MHPLRGPSGENRVVSAPALAGSRSLEPVSRRSSFAGRSLGQLEFSSLILACMPTFTPPCPAPCRLMFTQASCTTRRSHRPWTWFEHRIGLLVPRDSSSERP